jgi:transcriptional regulator with XRE-family HTH domain
MDHISILSGIIMPNSQSTLLLDALRRTLRRRGLRHADLAREFGVGEASIKRWLKGDGLTLAGLENLAGLAGLTLAELAQLADRPPDTLSRELTLAQEKALSEDELLSFVFIVTLAGESWQDIIDDFGVPEAAVAAALARLDKLALIDMLPDGRVRPRVVRDIIWRKAPMRAQFEARMKPQFMAMDFAAADAVYASDVHKLSDRGAAMLAELLERHRRELAALADDDRRTSRLPRRWYAVLLAARALDTGGLRQALGRTRS